MKSHLSLLCVLAVMVAMSCNTNVALNADSHQEDGVQEEMSQETKYMAGDATFSIGKSGDGYNIIINDVIPAETIKASLIGHTWFNNWWGTVDTEELNIFDDPAVGGSEVYLFDNDVVHLTAEPCDPNEEIFKEDRECTYYDNRVKAGECDYTIVSISDKKVYALIKSHYAPDRWNIEIFSRLD